ncbi:MAG: arylamine N-acetyltransferase [Caulobacterales bacterium]
MQLDRYLDRIGFAGDARPDLATLRAVHAAHLRSIPYENLDVQLGRPVTTHPADAYAKLVERRRGGWCYEMNGLLGWALGEIGFKVTRMAGAVMREASGDASLANHLVLLVELDDGPTMIADVGFGDGSIFPYALADGPFQSGAFKFRLEAMRDGWWRMRHHALGGASSFDFRAEPAVEARLAERCVLLQTSPQSIFVQNLLCFRHGLNGHWMLRGRVLRHVTPKGAEDRVLESADEFTDVLGEILGIDEPAAAGLWPRIVERHAEVFAGQGG